MQRRSHTPLIHINSQVVLGTGDTFTSSLPTTGRLVGNENTYSARQKPLAPSIGNSLMAIARIQELEARGERVIATSDAAERMTNAIRKGPSAVDRELQ